MELNTNEEQNEGKFGDDEPLVIRAPNFVRFGILLIVLVGLGAIFLAILNEIIDDDRQVLWVLALSALFLFMFIGGFMPLALEKKIFFPDSIDFRNSFGRVTRRGYNEIAKVEWATDGSHLRITFNDDFSMNVTRLEDPGRKVAAILKKKGIS